MIDDLDPKTRRRDGYDVAYMAVWCLGLVLVVLVLGMVALYALAGSTDISDGLTQVLIAGVGAISTVAGAALGYQVGSRAPRRSTDPGAPAAEAAPGPAPPAGPPAAAAGSGALPPRRVRLPET